MFLTKFSEIPQILENYQSWCPLFRKQKVKPSSNYNVASPFLDLFLQIRPTTQGSIIFVGTCSEKYDLGSYRDPLKERTSREVIKNVISVCSSSPNVHSIYMRKTTPCSSLLPSWLRYSSNQSFLRKASQSNV